MIRGGLYHININTNIIDNTSVTTTGLELLYYITPPYITLDRGENENRKNKSIYTGEK